MRPALIGIVLVAGAFFLVLFTSNFLESWARRPQSAFNAAVGSQGRGNGQGNDVRAGNSLRPDDGEAGIHQASAPAR